LRDPRDQAAWLILDGLRRAGSSPPRTDVRAELIL
jgi:hypothetical protein